MATQNVDILMMILDGSTGVPGEGQSLVDKKDAFTSDFVTGNFFEIEDFDLGIDLEDSDSSSKAKTPTTNTSTTQTKQTEDQQRGGKFSKWTQGLNVTATQGAMANMFPIQMDPFAFTRQIDKASPVLFQRCFLTKPFDSAVVVMRKVGGLQFSAGGTLTSNIAAIPFLRIEFSPVLITAIDWDAGEVVKEKCKFVCRSINVKYRPQNNDGSYGTIVENTVPLTLVKTT
jgi:type VI protein secretion system component Hcp